MPNRITAEQREQIVQWYAAGYSARAIAAEIGCGKDTVLRICSSATVTMTPTEKVAELMSQDKTTAQIAAELDMTISAVKSAYKRIKRALGPQAR